MFKLGEKSKKNLIGVHPRLVAVVDLAITYTVSDFTVLEGVRSVERQKELVAKGASKTMNSMHIKQSDGFGHAVDLIPTSKDPWNDKKGFEAIRDAMFLAAKELGVGLTWGGDWNRDGKSRDQGDKSEIFVDKPHYQLL